MVSYVGVCTPSITIPLLYRYCTVTVPLLYQVAEAARRLIPLVTPSTLNLVNGFGDCALAIALKSAGSIGGMSKMGRTPKSAAAGGGGVVGRAISGGGSGRGGGGGSYMEVVRQQEKRERERARERERETERLSIEVYHVCAKTVQVRASVMKRASCYI